MANNQTTTTSKGWKISYAAYVKKYKAAAAANLIRANSPMLTPTQYQYNYNRSLADKSYVYFDARGQMNVAKSSTIADFVIENQRKIGSLQAKEIARKFKSFIKEHPNTVNFISGEEDDIDLDNARNITYKEFPYGMVQITHTFERTLQRGKSLDRNNFVSTITYQKGSINSLAEAIGTLRKDKMYALLIDLGLLTKDEVDNYEGKGYVPGY